MTRRRSNPAAPRPGVSAYSLFDLFGGWKVSQRIQLGAGVNNIGDKGPQTIGGQAGTANPAVYDVIGRSDFAALAVQF